MQPPSRHASFPLHAARPLLALIVLLTLGASDVLAQPGGQADLLLRYPTQVTFTVWGNGTTYNDRLLEAAPGDALNMTLLVRPRGRDNTLDAAAEYRITVGLTGAGNETLLGETNGTIGPGATADIAHQLNVTLPSDLPPGELRLVFRLETGDWDPNPDNNDPAPVPLRIGTIERVPIPFRFETRYLIGPVLFAVLVASPFAHQFVRGRPAWRRTVDPLRSWWDAHSARWHQADPARRARLTVWTTLGALLFGFAVSTVATGGLARGGPGIRDAIILGAFGALVHLVVGTWTRWRRSRPATDGERPLNLMEATRATALPALQTFAVVLFASLLWQQLAQLTTFFRWPELGTLHGFAIIGVRHGAVYALIALGYTMVYGILKFINFAHGEIFTWGAYFIWMFAVGGVLGWKAAFPVAILLGILLTGALGAVMERVAYRPLRKATRLAPLVTAIALSVLLSAAVQFFFGPQPQSFLAQGTYRDSGLRSFFGHTVLLLGERVSYLAITVIVVSITLMTALHLFVQRSRTGRAMRAVADDLDTARTIGIRVDRVISITFILGSMLAAVGGLFYALDFHLVPGMGLIVGIKAFTAAVVGGIGNIHGAFLAGFLIALAENVGGQFIDIRFQRVIAFVILLVFLLVRPQGILAPKAEVERR